MTRLKAVTGETLRSFRNRNFRVYFAGQAVSQAGTWLQLVAQVLLILRLGGRATDLGLLTAIQFLPMLLLGAFSGVLTDRVDKRRMLYVTQSLLMVPAIGLGVLTITGRITIVGVYVLAAITGTVNAFDNPPRRSLLSDLVAPEDVTNAVSLNSTLMTGARLAGPALAAALIATVGIGWCFILNGTSFVAGLVAVRMLDSESMYPTPAVTRSKGQVREGFAYVWNQRELRLAFAVMAVVATLAFNWTVTLPILAERSLGGTENSYLALSVCVSIGSMLGALMLARLREVRLPRVIMLGAGFGISMIVLAAMPSMWSAMVAGVVTGGFGIAYLSSTASLLQIRAVPEMRGRVLALHAMVFLGSTPIGGPIAGVVTEHLGARFGLLLGAVPTLVVALVALRILRRRPLDDGAADAMPPRLPSTPTGPFRDPATQAA